MPHLFEILNDLVGGWSRDMKQEFDRMQLVCPTVKRIAEDLLQKMEAFFLFQVAERVDRPTVKARGNIVTGQLLEVGTCPRQNYKVTTLPKYITDSKNILKRRRYMNYSDFDQFQKDLSEMVVMEVIKLDDRVSNAEIFCNCLSGSGGRGSKGDMCIHVCARYFNVLYKVL